MSVLNLDSESERRRGGGGQSNSGNLEVYIKERKQNELHKEMAKR